LIIEIIYQHQHQQVKNLHFFIEENQNKQLNNKQMCQQIHYQVMIVQGKIDLTKKEGKRFYFNK